jgi:hypothetical protein
LLLTRRMALRYTLAGVCLALLGVASVAAQSIRILSNTLRPPRAVFVVAHQDDWQLFMGDVAAESLRKTSAVFIYLTAGDDGRDSAYWRTRERAALHSTIVAAGSQINPDSIECMAFPVEGHRVRKCLIGNIESYFLRLPDGRRNGAGFDRYSFQSMRKLRAKKIAKMTAVDGSAAYQGWEDLVSTVGSLVGASDGGVQIHTMDPGIAANPHDHFDHRLVGLLTDELRKRTRLDVRYYVGYALASRAANRSTGQAREKTAIFMAYDREMMRENKNWSAYREHPAFYSECMLRTYARTPREQ